MTLSKSRKKRTVFVSNLSVLSHFNSLKRLFTLLAFLKRQHLLMPDSHFVQVQLAGEIEGITSEVKMPGLRDKIKIKIIYGQ